MGAWLHSASSMRPSIEMGATARAASTGGSPCAPAPAAAAARARHAITQREPRILEGGGGRAAIVARRSGQRVGGEHVGGGAAQVAAAAGGDDDVLPPAAPAVRHRSGVPAGLEGDRPQLTPAVGVEGTEARVVGAGDEDDSA